MTNEAINATCLVKGGERYIFIYSDSNRVAALRTVARFADDPELSLTWYDAAAISAKIRQVAERDRQSRRW